MTRVISRYLVIGAMGGRADLADRTTAGTTDRKLSRGDSFMACSFIAAWELLGPCFILLAFDKRF